MKVLSKRRQWVPLGDKTAKVFTSQIEAICEAEILKLEGVDFILVDRKTNAVHTRIPVA